eukprot:6875557-Heterocapsa_arctica.AAC.1
MNNDRHTYTFVGPRGETIWLYPMSLSLGLTSKTLGRLDPPPVQPEPIEPLISLAAEATFRVAWLE